MKKKIKNNQKKILIEKQKHIYKQNNINKQKVNLMHLYAHDMYKSQKKNISISHNCPIVTLVDYKAILKSEYVAKRICDLSGHKLEVGWHFGGTVNTKEQYAQPSQLEKLATDKPSQENTQQNATTNASTQNPVVTKRTTIINIKDMYLPTIQRISPSDYEISSNGRSLANAEFAKMGMRYNAIGHSHGGHDVFHSDVDRKYFPLAACLYGVKIKPLPKIRTVQTITHSQPQRTINITNHVTQTITKQRKPYNVLPSLVFNYLGTRIDSALAWGVSKKKFIGKVNDNPIHVYNKKAVLSDAEKAELDQRIIQILQHNNIQIKSQYAHLIPKSDKITSTVSNATEMTNSSIEKKVQVA